MSDQTAAQRAVYEYPVVAPVPRPRVPIKWDDEAKSGVTARCHHCDYVKTGRFPAEIDLDAQHHRGLHREGKIPVTRGPKTAVHPWPGEAVAD